MYVHTCMKVTLCALNVYKDTQVEGRRGDMTPEALKLLPCPLKGLCIQGTDARWYP